MAVSARERRDGDLEARQRESVRRMAAEAVAHRREVQARALSRGRDVRVAALARLAARVEEWQDQVMRMARDADLDMVRVGLDRWEMETTLVEFVRERRLRKFS